MVANPCLAIFILIHPTSFSHPSLISLVVSVDVKHHVYFQLVAVPFIHLVTTKCSNRNKHNHQQQKHAHVCVCQWCIFRVLNQTEQKQICNTVLVRLRDGSEEETERPS